MPLSILYLRCLYGWRPHDLRHAFILAFNSLFEMRNSGDADSESVKNTFNSLFEMRYRASNSTNVVFPTPFNSLFEMLLITMRIPAL